ncbi:MAG: 30S ribosomal protein S3 [Candidatus Micrarchaeia archaeon]
MAIERKFIEDALVRYRVSSFLRNKLERVGFSNVAIQRTPMVTRITVEVANPGRLIGKKGRSIKKLTDIIAQEFGVSEPQIAVIPVENQDLEPMLVAKTVAKRIEADKPVRPTVHMALKRVMEAGALGAEIIVRGKLAAKGGKAKSMKVTAGYLPKAGDWIRKLRTADVVARPKYGAINVRVTIATKDAFPEARKVEIPVVIKYAEGETEGEPEAEPGGAKQGTSLDEKKA